MIMFFVLIAVPGVFDGQETSCPYRREIAYQHQQELNNNRAHNYDLSTRTEAGISWS